MHKRAVNCVIPVLRPLLSPRSLRLPLQGSHTHSTIRTQLNHIHQSNRFLTTTPTMSSDESYLSFLNNANADVSQPQASTSATAAPTTQSIHLTETIPASLSTIHETIYTSETDEPFDPVVLKWADASGGIWPDKTQFATMVSPVADAGLEGGITVCGVGEWDPRGMYGGVVRAVREAAGFGEKGEEGEGDDGEVRVYRVEVGVSRVEYFVVALERNGGRVVGVRARSVES